jgi:phosphoglycolate phosphatase-like HAD superfamily hydrolase
VIKNVIWDFDGTLFDTFSAFVRSAIGVMKERYSVLCDYSTVLKMAKESPRHCINELALENNLDGVKLKEEVWSRYSAVSDIEYMPFTGVREVCSHVSQIGCNLMVTHRDSNSLDELLEKHDLQKYFDEIVSRDDGFPQKPDPSSFNYLLEKHRLFRHETLGVGDTELDVNAAVNAGITSCYFDPDGVGMDIATYNIRSLMEVLHLLE